MGIQDEIGLLRNMYSSVVTFKKLLREEEEKEN